MKAGAGRVAQRARSPGRGAGRSPRPRRGGERYRSTAHSSCPKAWCARSTWGIAIRKTPSAPASPAAGDPRRAAARPSPAAIAGRRRVVVEVLVAARPAARRPGRQYRKPPASSSWKRSAASSARRIAWSSQRGSPVAVCSSIRPLATAATVVEKRRRPGVAVAVDRWSTPPGLISPSRNSAQPLGRRQVVGAAQPPAGLGQRGQRQPVPCGDRLVVARRAAGGRAAPRAGGRRSTRCSREARRPAAARWRRPRTCPRSVTPKYAAAAAPSSGAEHARQLLRRPHVRQPLLAQSVSASSAEAKPPSGSSMSRQQEVERALGDPPVARIAGDRVPVQVRGGQQCVVVQHLLEVRDEPLARRPSSGRKPPASTSYMPPAAIPSSVPVAISSAPPIAGRRCARSRNSIALAGGNLGARPEPAPLRVVHAAHAGAPRPSACSSASGPSAAGHPTGGVQRRGQPARRSRPPRRGGRGTPRPPPPAPGGTPGMPWRGSGGK